MSGRKLQLSEADTVWLLENLPMRTPIVFTFPGGWIDPDDCPEAVALLQRHWASAFI